MTPSGNRPRILIHGSCVSRDIFAMAASEEFRIYDYYARSSLATMASAPMDIQEENDLAAIASRFQRRMVARDMRKSFLQEVDPLAFDLLVLDLIDERFDLCELRPGALVTLSNEFFASGLLRRKEIADSRIRSGSERHRDLWLAGLDRLCTSLHALGCLDRLVINKVFWAARFEDGTPLPPRFPVDELERSNAHLAWMYRQLERFVSPAQWLDFPDRLLTADPAHRWGVSPFHYSTGYYAAALDSIRARAALRQPPSEAPLDIATAGVGGTDG